MLTLAESSDVVSRFTAVLKLRGGPAMATTPTTRTSQ